MIESRKIIAATARRIERELGPRDYSLFLAMIDAEIPAPQMARALGVECWQIVVWRKCVAELRYAVAPEARPMKKKPAVQLVYTKQEKRA